MDDKDIKIIISEDVSNQYNGKTNNNVIINPVLVMKAPFVPTALSLGITVILSNITFTDNKVKISILDPKNKKEIYTTGDNNYKLPKEADNYLFNISLKNIPFMTEGEYTVKVEINNRDFTDVFKVKAESELE